MTFTEVKLSVFNRNFATGKQVRFDLFLLDILFEASSFSLKFLPVLFLL